MTKIKFEEFVKALVAVMLGYNASQLDAMRALTRIFNGEKSKNQR